MNIGTCATCVYYRDYKNECRYNPPQIRGDGYSIWPKVDNDDYCHGWTDARVNGRKLTFPERVAHLLKE